MASSSSAGASSSYISVPPSSSRKPSLSAKATDDPILRNALRYTISAREYATLHRYILSRSRAIKKRVPSIEHVNRIMNGEIRGKSKEDDDKGKGKEVDIGNTSAGAGASAGAMVGADDYNARAVRHSIRVFIATGAAMKLWGIVAQRLMGQKRE